MTSIPNDWLEKLEVLDKAERTWHKLTLPEGTTAIRVREVLEDGNIGRYIWNCDDLILEQQWVDPIGKWSDAKHVLFENEKDIVMFMLKL